MAVAVGKIGHEDRVSVVDHLDELRTRLLVSLAAVVVAIVHGRTIGCYA
jgi:Sec-independent protein secretion pathway component TatC